MRLVYMGTPDFAVPALAALLAAGHEVACVYSQPPRPAGRGQKEQRSPVHELALARGLAVRTPASLKAEAAQREFADLKVDAAIVAAYGLILPKPVLTAPRFGCFNIHASLLPRWRGAAPIQRAILAGDVETGVTIMQMDEGLDTGAMLRRARTPIGPDDTAQTLHDRLAEIGAREIVAALRDVEAGTAAPEPQPAGGVTYAAKLSRDDGRLDWTRPAVALERQVRAFDPWPGAWFEHAGERIKVLAAKPVRGVAGIPGTVVAAGPVVACGEDGLQLLRLQRPGKAPLEAGAFLRGYPLPSGTRLGG
ncbi:MAG: methionyl-tRNA formyltransferase [Alphaproteobacteria bacterium]|nr:methionyl-tRNA formyltransferase [Alphaproteobacteria bacterium]